MLNEEGEQVAERDGWHAWSKCVHFDQHIARLLAEVVLQQSCRIRI